MRFGILDDSQVSLWRQPMGVTKLIRENWTWRCGSTLHGTRKACIQDCINVVSEPNSTPNCELTSSFKIAYQSAVVRCALDSSLIQSDESKGFKRVIGAFGIHALQFSPVKHRGQYWPGGNRRGDRRICPRYLAWSDCWESGRLGGVLHQNRRDSGGGGDHTVPGKRLSWLVGGFQTRFAPYPWSGLPLCWRLKVRGVRGRRFPLLLRYQTQAEFVDLLDTVANGRRRRFHHSALNPKAASSPRRSAFRPARFEDDLPKTLPWYGRAW